MLEEITTKRLENYGAVARELDDLLQYKKNIIAKYPILRSFDFAKTKVQTGNGHKTSEQEYYAIRLQAINGKIAEYQAWLEPEKEIIKNQIARVPKRVYRRLLVLRYIEGWKWREIVQEFFELKEDFAERKNDKYWDTVMYWNRRALIELEKISKKPYVPVQLNFK